MTIEQILLTFMLGGIGAVFWVVAFMLIYALYQEIKD